MHWELHSCIVSGRVALMHDRIVILECICWINFCKGIPLCYLMEIIMLTTEILQLLLTHRVEDNSRVVRHCNKKVASQVVTWALTTGILFS